MTEQRAHTPRRNPRSSVTVSVVIRHPKSVRRIHAELSDISPDGCRVQTTEPLKIGDHLVMSIEGLEPWPARIIWVSGEDRGAEFDRPLHPAVADHIARIYPSQPSQL
jgi:hypothetical protein